MGRNRLQKKVELIFDDLSAKEKVIVRHRYGDDLVSWYLEKRVASIRDGIDKKDRRERL